jgi:hypothetical protein
MKPRRIHNTENKFYKYFCVQQPTVPNGVREWSCGIDDTLGPHSELFAADFVPAHGAARFPFIVLKINQLYR